MNTLAQDEYLVNEVLTAAPQKLHLMLLDAALRLAQRAEPLWNQARDEEAGEALLRAQEIVTELLAGLAAHREAPLARRVAAEYTFVFNSLVQAHLRKDRSKLADAIRVVQEERATWQQVCSQLGTSAVPPLVSDAVAEPAQHGFSFQA